MAKTIKTIRDKSNRQPAGNPLQIPARFLAPVRDFLQSQLGRLEKRRSTLEKDDPFIAGRAENMASPDTSAAEQFGHARLEAMRKEIDRKLIQVRKALARIKVGSYGICEECGEMIDTDRLMVYPETTLCIKCERRREGKRK